MCINLLPHVNLSNHEIMVELVLHQDDSCISHSCLYAKCWEPLLIQSFFGIADQGWFCRGERPGCVCHVCDGGGADLCSQGHWSKVV